MSKRQTVTIAIPTRHQLHGAMQESLQHVIATTQRTKPVLSTLRAESLICRARATLLARWLAGDAEWIYFWDDDLQTLNTGGPAGNLLDMLVSHGKEFIGGLYATRGLGGHCAARAIPDNPAAGRIWEVHYLAGGSMLIHRDAARRIVADNAGLEYATRANSGAGVPTAWAVFVPIIHDGEYLSEDYAFCERYRHVGGRIYADLDVKLWHWGEAPFSVVDPRKAG